MQAGKDYDNDVNDEDDDGDDDANNTDDNEEDHDLPGYISISMTIVIIMMISAHGDDAVHDIIDEYGDIG